ncbi:MAG TPA: response regulator transcription factor [Rhizobacter sp.]|nr:response regulator transcription factor [Rhizobacter sp.]
MSLRIALVDDHAPFRACVRQLLAQHGFEVVAECDEGTQLLDALARTRPDVVVLDVSMPGMDGPQTARHLRAHHPGVRIVALSMHDDPRVVAAMAAAGAQAYLRKDDALPDLPRVLHKLAASGDEEGSPPLF